MRQAGISTVVLSVVALATVNVHAQVARAPVAAANARAAMVKVAAPAGELSSRDSGAPATALPTAAPSRAVRNAKADPIAEQTRRIQALRAHNPALAAASVASVKAITLPGIREVDGKTAMAFEPNGRYLISGAGFGERSGRVTLRPGSDSRPIELTVITWKDSHVFVEVPADISGVADYANVELTVASPNGRPLISNRFGFRAARALVALPHIPRDALRIDPTFLGEGLKINYAVGGPTGTFSVQRSLVDPDRSGCYERPRDMLLSRQIPLAKGFEVYSLDWTHDGLRNAQTSTTHETGFYSYDLMWQDEHIALLRSGVQRLYFKKQFDPVAIIKWLSTMGHYDAFKPGQALCTSRYVVTVNVSGPRGVAPYRQEK